MTADKDIPTFASIPLKLQVTVGAAEPMCVRRADAAGAEMHDKLTIPTWLTVNEATGRCATTDDIATRFSFIVWQDCA